MARIGIAFSGGPSASETVNCIQLAESLGYESAWVAEGHGGDQFSILSSAALTTTTIKLGTAISSVFVRSAPTIAMAAATVDDLSKGRFILGLGSSHKVQVTPEHGFPFSKPITRVRETVDVVRQLLADGSIVYYGETITIEQFELWFKPYRPELPIYLAGLFPKMTSVCGEIADGIILTRSTTKSAAEINKYLTKGAAITNRNASAIDIASLLPTAVANSRAEAIEMIRPGLAFYVGFFPRYKKLIATHGFEEEANEIANAFANGDMGRANRAVTESMVEATSVVGTPGQCRARIEAYRQSGISLPIISPFARGQDAKSKFEKAIRACAGT